MSEWLAMGGHGFYIWSSYAMLAFAVVVELWSLGRRRAEAHRTAQELREMREAERGA